VTIPTAQPFFAVTAHPAFDWIEVLAVSLVPVTVVEVAKWFRRRPSRYDVRPSLAVEKKP
jgi:hypothetical protein